MEVDVAMVSDVVDFDSGRRNPYQSHENCGRRHFDGPSCSSTMLSSDGPSGHGDVGMETGPCLRSVEVDTDTRLVQSAVTGDWRFVTNSTRTSTSSTSPGSPESTLELGGDTRPEGGHRRPLRRRYLNIQPGDMGVGIVAPPSSRDAVASPFETEVPISTEYGIGRSGNYFPPVFQPPRQGNGQHSRAVGGPGLGTVIAASSSVCQLDVSLRAVASATAVSSAEMRELIDDSSLPDVRPEYAASNVVLSEFSSAASTAVTTSVRCLPDAHATDSVGNAVAVSTGLSDPEHKAAEVAVQNSTDKVAGQPPPSSGAASDFETEFPISRNYPVANESVFPATSPSTANDGGNGIVPRSSAHMPIAEDTDIKDQTDRYGGALCRYGSTDANDVVVEDGVVKKNCALSMQFAADADLEADLLSSRLLREFREAIKSAVDSISSAAVRSNLCDDDLPSCHVSPRSVQSSLVPVEQLQKSGRQDSFEKTVLPASCTPARLGTGLGRSSEESRNDSEFRQFRLSNIPTLNGVNRCRRPGPGVVDELGVSAQCRRAPAPGSNVFRHRRSLPDASQLRCLSTSSLSSSRDASFPSGTGAARMRSLLVIGGLDSLKMFGLNSCRLLSFRHLKSNAGRGI